MITKTTGNEVTVLFSADEAVSAGLPKRGCFIKYKNGLLDDISCWLFKQGRFEKGIDHLQLLADQAIYH